VVWPSTGLIFAALQAFQNSIAPNRLPLSVSASAGWPSAAAAATRAPTSTGAASRL